jgi:hypothetical protein
LLRRGAPRATRYLVGRCPEPIVAVALQLSAATAPPVVDNLALLTVDRR